jgi:hypothetical protein
MTGKTMTPEDLQLNEQAAEVASSALSEPVKAAAMATLSSMDELVKTGAARNGFMRGLNRIGARMQQRMGNMDRKFSHNLPRNFLLAVTETQVHALEQKEEGGSLIPGEKIEAWDRSDVIAKPNVMTSLAMVKDAVPEDRQALILFLPFQMRGKPAGKAPMNIVLGTDPASQALTQELVGQQVLANAANAAEMIHSKGL